MLAYHNDPKLKQQILEQLQGSSWNASIEEYESRFGIPKRLAHLEEQIFDGLPNEEAKSWPIRFMSAIQVGADLSTIWRDFAIWMLVDSIDGVIKYTQPGSDAHRVIMQVAHLYQNGYTHQQMMDAAEVAHAAAYAAYANASAAAADAAYFAHVAAADASYAAAKAAYAAYADAAAGSHVSYNARYAAAAHATYIKISNKLIELLEKQEVNHDHK